jgi:diacylglycerol kinase
MLLPVGLLAKGLLVSSLILILLMELANTAVEVVVDRISSDCHELSKKRRTSEACWFCCRSSMPASFGLPCFCNTIYKGNEQ